MIGSVVVAIATIAVAAIIGCSSLGGGSRKANIATVIQTAYDMGGREATIILLSREGMPLAMYRLPVRR